jgi:large subunit ribosomal protein L13
LETDAKITKSFRNEDVQRHWWIVDAEGMTLGRLATQVARILRGKHQPFYTPHIDNGDFVVVINAQKINLHPKRAVKKEYYHNTLYPGGARFKSYTEMKTTKPEYIIKHAVMGMLPKNILGRKIIKKLKKMLNVSEKNKKKKHNIKVKTQ